MGGGGVELKKEKICFLKFAAGCNSAKYFWCEGSLQYNSTNVYIRVNASWLAFWRLGVDQDRVCDHLETVCRKHNFSPITARLMEAPAHLAADEKQIAHYAAQGSLSFVLRAGFGK